ncbi:MULTISPECIES: DUF3343 domain-containing protein [Tissierellales]|jgi:hypothetical protein|uniref:DUF3343 domain-containing protein n=1 Tax=Acidilutibacter cellobiosedens TaxID=2507161 RepID=A0A410Q7Y2_9FIRM|nr:MULTISPECIES: DUF3343 domain-containing protein [Tissierellales]QAT60089.1 DUF3343 domain-containing protein [Acidilutibacter cellobiosedens]SCL92357.1 hypothetical protein PP176A_2273 [Sporanaerobacter sp. PP17-6a]
MIDESFGVIAFNSTSHAIKGEKIFKNQNLKIKTIPTPQEITANCGLSILFDLGDKETIYSIIKDNNLEIKGMYKLIRKDKKKYIEEISM